MNPLEYWLLGVMSLLIGGGVMNLLYIGFLHGWPDEWTRKRSWFYAGYVALPLLCWVGIAWSLRPQQ